MSEPYQKYTTAQVPLPERQDQLVTFNATYLADIPAAIKQWRCSRTILVVSRSLDQNTDKIRRLEEILGETVVGKQVGVGAHSPYADVLSIAKLAHEKNADSIVCIGGSSYSDAVKIARLLHATFPDKDLSEELMESLVDQVTGITPRDTFKTPKTRLILVPCSLSVAEYSSIASASNRNGKKQHFATLNDTFAASDLVLLDPEIASTAPPDALWLPSGARAIDHAVETLCSSLTEPEGFEVAISSLKSLIHGLKAYKDGLSAGKSITDESIMRAISDCQRGARDSIMGLLVYKSTVGPSHAIGHQLGSVAGVRHGLTSCIGLPATLRYAKKHTDNSYFRVTGQNTVLDIFNKELRWQETEASDAVEKYYRSLGLPTKLSKVVCLFVCFNINVY
jgi:alcohol dehydrogenase class IV